MESLLGRQKIITDETSITSENIAKVLREAFMTHLINQSEIEQLYDYRRGNQPILNREKTIRPEINNKVVENRAHEIIEFKVGYLLGEPIQYVSRGGDGIPEAVSHLNSLMALCGKATKDRSLVEWAYISGVGYRFVYPNRFAIKNSFIPRLLNKTNHRGDEAPFDIFTLDPRSTFCVYSSALGEPKLIGVKATVRKGDTIFTAYTSDRVYEVINDTVSEQLNPLGAIPIIEYPMNNSRLGAFEVVLPILNAINDVQSDRLNGIAQFIQSLVVLVNAEVDDDKAQQIRDAGLITLKSYGDNKSELKILSEELDQQQTQVLIDYLYQAMLNICGMPNRNGGLSTSDTGAAVRMRDGFEAAESRAKSDEMMFRQSEYELLKTVLQILRDTEGTPLRLSDIEIKLPRRNYENIQGKAQVFAQLIQSGYCDVEEAYAISNLSLDPAGSATRGLAWREKLDAALESELNNLV